jgi:hypothetical protein
VVSKMFRVALVLEMHVAVVCKAFKLELFTAFSLLVRIVLIAFIFVVNSTGTVYACSLI